MSLNKINAQVHQMGEIDTYQLPTAIAEVGEKQRLGNKLLLSLKRHFLLQSDYNRVDCVNFITEHS